MAKFELSIYGENDDVVKQYATNIIPWGIYIDAVEMQEKIAKKSAIEQMGAIGTILKSVFKGLTDDELKCADGLDVMNTFKQIAVGGRQIKGGNSKNA